MAGKKKETLDPHMKQKADIEALIPVAPEAGEIDPQEELEVPETPIPTPAPRADLPSGGETESSLREAIAQLQSQMTTMETELSTANQNTYGKGDNIVDQGIEGYPWQYYRLPNKGVQANWVTNAPGGATTKGQRSAGAYSNYLRKGLKPITRYGPCPVPTTERGWESYIPMLRKGGAVEFPAEQVLAYKWHLRPPIRGLKFPSVEKLNGKFLHALCEECEFELFSVLEDKTISRAFLMHLRGRHEYARREAILSIREQGLPSVGRYALEQQEQPVAEASPGSIGYKSPEVDPEN